MTRFSQYQALATNCTFTPFSTHNAVPARIAGPGFKTIRTLTIGLLAICLLQACTPEPLDILAPQVETKPFVATHYYYDTTTQQPVLLATLTKTGSAKDMGYFHLSRPKLRMLDVNDQ